MASITYYTLNLEQNFSFPHDNADTYTDEQLWSHYSSQDYLCAYLIRQLGHKDPHPILDALSRQPYAKDYAAAWMRLKFLCEVMEPTRILKKRDAMPPKVKARLNLSAWTIESLTEEFYTLEVVTNILGQHLFDVVKSLTEEAEPQALCQEFSDIIVTFNKNIYALRQTPLDQCQWNLWNPYDLMPFVWAKYIVGAKEASSCLNATHVVLSNGFSC